MTGVVIARTPPYAQLPTDAPTKARIFFGSPVTHFSRDPSLSSTGSFVPFSTRKPQAKAVPRKDFFTHLRSPAKSTSSVSAWILRSDAMSEEHKKGTLSDQPRLTRVTSTALLCHWGCKLLKEMTSLGTDVETHAIWQGYMEEPTAKDFVARKAGTIALSKAHGTHWNVIKCKSRLGIIQMLS